MSKWLDDDDRCTVIVDEYELRDVVGDMTAVGFECNKGYRSSVMDIRLSAVGEMSEEDRKMVEEKFNKVLDSIEELDCLMDDVCNYTDKLRGK